MIDDFRHLLALGILLLFGLTLIWGLFLAGTELDKFLEVVQVIMGAFGGLTGVIAGFYFSEFRSRGEVEVRNEVDGN